MKKKEAAKASGRTESPEVRQYWQDFFSREEVMRKEIAKWEAIPTPTATDLARKEARLAELRTDLAELEAEYHEALRRAQERSTLAELAVRWNMTEADIHQYSERGELTIEVRPDAPYTLHDFPLDQLEEVSGRILLVSREERDRFELAHGIMAQQDRPFTRGTLEEAADAMAKQHGWHKGARDTLLKQMMDAAKDGSLIVRHPHTDLPYRPKTVRTFYELVTADDVNAWLESQSVAYRLGTDSKVPASAVVSLVPLGGDAPSGKVLGRRDAQISDILEAIKELGYSANQHIPNGGKRKIKVACEEKESRLFSGEAFNHAWKAAMKQGKIHGERKRVQ